MAAGKKVGRKVRCEGCGNLYATASSRNRHYNSNCKRNLVVEEESVKIVESRSESNRKNVSNISPPKKAMDNHVKATAQRFPGSKDDSCITRKPKADGRTQPIRITDEPSRAQRRRQVPERFGQNVSSFSSSTNPRRNYCSATDKTDDREFSSDKSASVNATQQPASSQTAADDYDSSVSSNNTSVSLGSSALTVSTIRQSANASDRQGSRTSRSHLKRRTSDDKVEYENHSNSINLTRSQKASVRAAVRLKGDVDAVKPDDEHSIRSSPSAIQPLTANKNIHSSKLPESESSSTRSAASNRSLTKSSNPEQKRSPVPLTPEQQKTKSGKSTSRDVVVDPHVYSPDFTPGPPAKLNRKRVVAKPSKLINNTQLLPNPEAMAGIRLKDGKLVYAKGEIQQLRAGKQPSSKPSMKRAKTLTDIRNTNWLRTLTNVSNLNTLSTINSSTLQNATLGNISHFHPVAASTPAPRLLKAAKNGKN